MSLAGFAIPNTLRFDDSNGLTRGLISVQDAEAEFYLHGAHFTRWQPRAGRPVLFTSSKSLFTPGKPIRGGVPIVFPWFGPRSDGQPGPIHGFARIEEWSIESAQVRDDGALAIVFTLPPQLRFTVTVGAQLHMALEVRNLSAEPSHFEAALHTYFAIGDIHQVSVTGLEGTTYIDKTDGAKRKVLGNDAIRIVKETDQVHLNTQATCVIHDPAWNRRIEIEKAGSDTTVVWNPWIEKTKMLADMAPEDWREMICVETANAVDNAIHLPPGASHTMRASIRVE